MRPRGRRRSFCECRNNIADLSEYLSSDASHAYGTSILELKVFAKRTVTNDKYIGEMQETMQSLFTLSNDGGIAVFLSVERLLSNES